MKVDDKLLNKKIKIVLKDGDKETLRYGRITWIGSHFFELKSSQSLELWPIKSIIRVELL